MDILEQLHFVYDMNNRSNCFDMIIVAYDWYFIPKQTSRYKDVNKTSMNANLSIFT